MLGGFFGLYEFCLGCFLWLVGGFVGVWILSCFFFCCWSLCFSVFAVLLLCFVLVGFFFCWLFGACLVIVFCVMVGVVVLFLLFL